MSNGSYNVDRIDQIYTVLQAQGYLGTKEDLIRQMGQTDDFNRIMTVMNSAGFKGDERDLIYLSGINPKKKESAFSSDYVAGLESLTGDSSFEPVQDLESARKQAEENRSGYLSSLFGEAQDPYEMMATMSAEETGRGREYTPEDIQELYETDTQSVIEAYTTEGSAPSEYQANQREYFIFKETQKWLQGRGVLGNALSEQEREGFSKEIFDTLKDTPLFTGTSVTTKDINDVMLSAGLIVDRAELSSSKENLKTSIINNEFGIGKYTEEQVQALPEVEDEEGMSMPFYESQLGNINSSYIPQTDEELAAIQPNMPEKINTFEKASDYYLRRNIEFSEDKYKQIAGYWNARNEVVQAEDGKKAAISELEAFVDRFNTAVTEEERQEVQADLASRRTDIINTYNEANEVLGLERRAYNISELIGQVALDQVAMESDMALQAYRTSGEFLGRQLEEDLIAPNLFKTVGMVFSGVLNFTDAILDTAEGDQDFFDSASFQDLYAGILGVEPDQAPTFGELSAGISQANNLKKGLTLEQIQRGVFGQKFGDEYARGVMFTSMVAEALPQIGLQIVGLATGATEATLISFALGSAGSTIEDLNQNSNLTAGEKLAFGTLAGGIEYLSEKLFMKAELGSADAIRKAVGLKPLAGRGGKALLWGTVPAEKGVLLQAKNVFDKVTTNRAFRFLEEGIEEGLVSVADQGLRNYAERLALDREIEDIQKKIDTPGIASEVQDRLEKSIAAKEIQKAQLSVSWGQVADSFVVGVAAGGIQTGIVRAPSYVASKFRLKDQIRLQNRYEELSEQFKNATTKEERDDIKRKMLAVQEEQHRVAARDLSFLANVSDEDAEAIFGHNQDITGARKEAQKLRALLAQAKAANNKAAVATYEAQIKLLQNQIKESFKKKFEIESKYAQNENSVDIALEDPEVQAVIREVGSTDPDITEYGRVGRGNSVELTSENAGSVIDRIIASGKIVTTAFSNREDIIRGLQNIKNIIATVTEAGTGGKVFLHGTTKAYEKATGQRVARGVHVVYKRKDDGTVQSAEVHLFLPALQANTPYHEAFHQATLQNENQDDTKAGTRRLAATLARLVPNIEVFSRFIAGYLPEEQRSVLALAEADPAMQRKLLMQIVSENDTAADELLTEIKSLITSGTLSIEFKAGLISGLKEFVSRTFGTSFKDPKLKAVVAAIDAATQTMARGEAVADTEAIIEAGLRLQEGPTAIDEEEDDANLDDREARAQRVFRAGDLTRKAETQHRMRFGRSTGHFGTGFYFIGTRAAAEAYAQLDLTSRVVTSIDLENDDPKSPDFGKPNYTLALATRPLHDALRRLNDGNREAMFPDGDMRFREYMFDILRPLAVVKGEARVSTVDSKTAAQRAQEIYDSQKELPYLERESISTIALKALGFEGVNAIGTDLDNFQFGTVIFDIKPETVKASREPTAFEKREARRARRRKMLGLTPRQVDEDGNSVQPGLDSQESVTEEGLPVDPAQVQAKKQAINVAGTYMANQPRVDIGKLLSDFKAENNRNPVVWVWMADQLKRGTYSNPDTGVEAEVLGGIGFSTDQQNQDNDVVWASGLSPKTLNDRVGRADYIFLMSGSPKSAHNFSKGTSKVLIQEIEAGMKRNIGKTFGGVEIVEGSFDEFVQITNSLLKDKTETKKWMGVLKALNSRGKDVVDHPSRKTFVQNMLHQGMGVKPSLEFHTFLHDELGVPKQDVFNQLLRDEYLAQIDAQTGDIVGVLEPTGIQEDSDVHDTYQHSILGKFVGTPTSLFNVVDIVPTEIVQQLAKAGADIAALTKSALIKTIAGDVGGVFSDSQIDLIRSSIESLSDADTTVESVTKRQGIVSTVADIMTEPGFTLKQVGRGKKKKLVLEKSDQIRLFKPKKEEVLKVLEDSGMSKKDAEETYKKAVQFARGRRVGRTEQGKVVSKIRREKNKLSNEAKKLREDLDALKNKVSTVQQFIREARKLIKDRMAKDKGASKVFTVKQLTEFFKVMSQLSRSSAKKLKGNELEYIDAHLDKLAAIFDEQDAKGAMERHLKNLQTIRQFQSTLKRKSKQRDFTTYADLALALSRIKASLIPLEELEAFMDLLNTVNNNMRRGRFAKDEEGNLVFNATQLNEVKALQAQLDAFKAIEQAQQQAQLRARAERAVERKLLKGEETTFEAEYEAILKKFFESRLSATQKRVNKMAEKLGLDPRNVDDLETIYLELAKEEKALVDLKKSLIIDEGIMPLLLFNAEAILADPGFRLILGLPQNANIEDDEVFNKIRKRLDKLEKHHLLAIEFKLNDYLVNGRTFGLGYLAALTKGRINYADKIKELTDRGISSKRTAVLGVLDNLSSLLRNLFRVSNRDIARIKVAIGLQDVIMAINAFEQRHLETAQGLQDKIDEINKKFSLKGKTEITSKLSQALSQIYSMSRQMPKEFVEEARAASRTQEEFEQRLAEKKAAWYKALRDSMRATIEDIEQNQSAVQETIDQFKEAFDFLFTGEATLEALQNRVQTGRPEVVEMVDFMVEMHERARPDLEIFAERFLGKELGVLDNYTPFQIRKTSKDEDVESVMALRNALVSRMQASSRGGVQKTPGATFEREQRAVGGDAILGLNFIDINHDTLRENALITTALGDILAMEYAFGTEAFGNLVKDEAAGQLKQYIRDFLQVETQSEPFIFSSRVRVGDKTLLNPIESLRAAAVVGAFGSIFVQVVKQGTVGLATFMNMRSISSMMYFIQESTSILALTFVGTDIEGKRRVLSDPTVKLPGDKFELLKRSAAFLRDYRAGNIDPFQGNTNFDRSRFRRLRDMFTNKSLWALTTTDKAVAVASFFAYYADFLIEQGIVTSASDIDWTSEAANPNSEALAYADNMLEKDQNTSSARMAAAIYKKAGGAGRSLMQAFFPFQSFAINTKRSLTADVGRLLMGEDLQARKDGLRGFAATMSSLFAFHIASKMTMALFNEIVKQAMGDDDDEEKEFDVVQTLKESGVSAVVDALPVPSIGMVDDNVRDAFNYYVFFNEADYDIPGLEKEDKFALFKKYGPAIPTYGDSYADMAQNEKEPGTRALYSLLGLTGPAGQKFRDITTAIDRLNRDGKSYTTNSGSERFVRPEDQEHMQISTILRTALHGANLVGLGSKELEYFAKAMDDMPMNRSLTSEEEAAAYEFVTQAFSEDPELRAYLEAGEDIGVDKLMRILKMQAESDLTTLDKNISTSKFKSALKPAVAEKLLQNMMPEQYSKHANEMRRLSKESSKKIASVLKAKEREMTEEEYNAYFNFAFFYLGIKSEAGLESILTEKAFATP